MTSVLTTKNTLNPRGQNAPSGALKVDYTHPTANAINAFVVHGQTQGIHQDLVSGGVGFWSDNTTPLQAGVSSLGLSSRSVPIPSGSSTTGSPFLLTKTSLANGTGDFTIGGQFIINSVPGAGVYAEIFGQSDNAVSNYVDVYISSSTIMIAETTNTTNGLVLGANIQLGLPYTAFITRSGTTISTYVNGVLTGTGGDTNSLSGPTFRSRWGAWGTGFTIGPSATNIDNLWTGGWNRCLSTDEIQYVTLNPYDHITSAEGEFPALLQASSGVSGTLTATDIQDTAAFAGNLNVFGTLTATDPTDTAAFNGTVLVSGTLAVTENPDIPSFAGLIGNVVSGTLTVTETADIAALTGSLNVFGTFAAVESQDTGAFSGTVLISGTLTATDNPDVANFTGSITSALSGTLSATERQDIALFLSDPIVGGAWRWKEGVAELQKNRQTVVVNQTVAIQKAAAVLSKMGGEARAKSLTAVQRTTIATNAAKARWK